MIQKNWRGYRIRNVLKEICQRIDSQLTVNDSEDSQAQNDILEYEYDSRALNSQNIIEKFLPEVQKQSSKKKRFYDSFNMDQSSEEQQTEIFQNSQNIIQRLNFLDNQEVKLEKKQVDSQKQLDQVQMSNTDELKLTEKLISDLDRIIDFDDDANDANDEEKASHSHVLYEQEQKQNPVSLNEIIPCSNTKKDDKNKTQTEISKSLITIKDFGFQSDIDQNSVQQEKRKNSLYSAQQKLNTEQMEEYIREELKEYFKAQNSKTSQKNPQKSLSVPYTSNIDQEKQKQLSNLTEEIKFELEKLHKQESQKWENLIQEISLIKNEGFSQKAFEFIQKIQEQSKRNDKQFFANRNLEGLLGRTLSLITQIQEDKFDQNQFETVQPQQELQMHPLSERKSIEISKEQKQNRSALTHSPKQAKNTIKMSEIPMLADDSRNIEGNEDKSSRIFGEKSVKDSGKYDLSKRRINFEEVSFDRDQRSYQKKLQIDTDQINQEFLSKSQSHLKQQINQISEQILKDQSSKSLSQILSPLTVKFNQSKDVIQKFQQDLKQQNNIFQQEPFRDFAINKLKDIADNDDVHSIIQMRKKALEIRQKTQKETYDQMLFNQRVSPTTYNAKKLELEKWVSQEKQKIMKTQRDIEKGWIRTADTIQKTQRDIQFAQSLMNQENSQDYLSIKLKETNDLNECVKPYEEQKDINTSSQLSNSNKGEKHKISGDSQNNFENFLNLQKKSAENLSRRTNNQLSQNAENYQIHYEEFQEFQKQRSFSTENRPSQSQIIIEQEQTDENSCFSLQTFNYLKNQQELNSKKKIKKNKQEIFDFASEQSQKKIDAITESIFQELLVELDTEKIYFTQKTSDINYEDILFDSPNRQNKVNNKQIDIQYAINSPQKEILQIQSSFKQELAQNQSKSKENSCDLNQQQIDLNKKLKGIKTNISIVNDFLNLLISEIKDHLKESFMHDINIPIIIAGQDILRIIQQNQFSRMNPSFPNPNYLINQMQKTFDGILTEEIFLQTESKFRSQNRSEIVEKFQIDQIHSRMLFDVYNYCLNNFRPNGIENFKVPWKATFSRFRKSKRIESEFNHILEKTKEKTLEWAACICGFIPDKEDSPFIDNLALDEGYLAQIREDRMARMLAQEVLEEENEWINYEIEETEVQLELSDAILERVVLETIENLLTIQDQRKSPSYFFNTNQH